MTKKKAKTTNVLVGFCLDETGSMLSCRDATVSGFNEYIDDLKAQTGETRLSITLFSDMFGAESTFRPLCEAASVSDVPRLGAKNYNPRGNTPLYDAIGHTIDGLAKWLGDDEGDWSVMFVIQTDGYENASREYGRQGIFDLIRSKEADGWRFIYLGADQDSFTAERLAQSMGMQAGSTFAYATMDSAATLSSVGATTASYRSSGGTLTSPQLAAEQKRATDKRKKQA